MPGKDALNCKFRWLKLTKTPIQDQPWTVIENQHLQDLVNKLGKKAWSQIAQEMFYLSKEEVFRSAKQCREHYNNHLDPRVKRGTWNQKEDLELLNLIKQIGKKWSEIAKRLEGRTENAVKNRFNAIFRKEIEKLDQKLEIEISQKVVAQLKDNNSNEQSNQSEQYKLNLESSLIDKVIVEIQGNLQKTNNPNGQKQGGELELQSKILLIKKDNLKLNNQISRIQDEDKQQAYMENIDIIQHSQDNINVEQPIKKSKFNQIYSEKASKFEPQQKFEEIQQQIATQIQLYSQNNPSLFGPQAPQQVSQITAGSSQLISLQAVQSNTSLSNAQIPSPQTPNPFSHHIELQQTTKQEDLQNQPEGSTTTKTMKHSKRISIEEHVNSSQNSLPNLSPSINMSDHGFKIKPLTECKFDDLTSIPCFINFKLKEIYQLDWHLLQSFQGNIFLLMNWAQQQARLKSSSLRQGPFESYVAYFPTSQTFSQDPNNSNQSIQAVINSSQYLTSSQNNIIPEYLNSQEMINSINSEKHNQINEDLYNFNAQNQNFINNPSTFCLYTQPYPQQQLPQHLPSQINNHPYFMHNQYTSPLVPNQTYQHTYEKPFEK